MKGDVLNWENSSWKIWDMKETLIDEETSCKGAKVGSVLVTGKWNMHDAHHLCHGLGGLTTVVVSEQQQHYLIDVFNQQPKCTLKSKRSREKRSCKNSFYFIVVLQLIHFSGMAGGMCQKKEHL